MKCWFSHARTNYVTSWQAGRYCSAFTARASWGWNDSSFCRIFASAKSLSSADLLQTLWFEHSCKSSSKENKWLMIGLPRRFLRAYFVILEARWTALHLLRILCSLSSWETGKCEIILLEGFIGLIGIMCFCKQITVFVFGKACLSRLKQINTHSQQHSNRLQFRQESRHLYY